MNNKQLLDAPLEIEYIWDRAKRGKKKTNEYKFKENTVDEIKEEKKIKH